MQGSMPESLGIIAGRGAYPRLLAEAARREGVRRLFAVAFRWETDPVIKKVVDEVAWIRLGQLGGMLDAFRRSGVRQVVMAGQIKPTRLFSLRMDRKSARSQGVVPRMKSFRARIGVMVR